MDYNSDFEGQEVERLLLKIADTYTRDEVDAAITSAITNTLNTPV